METTVLPIYRAEAKEWGDSITGSLFLSEGIWCIIRQNASYYTADGRINDVCCFDEYDVAEIKTETAEASFDNGETWKKITLENTTHEEN